MARIFKEEDFFARRNDILDVVQGLVFTKGYQQMTIQDILDELHISKGAFYHYFDSKQALLEALVERSQSAALEVLRPIVEEPQLSALEKTERFFSTLVGWKSAQKDYLIVLLRAWYLDENIVLRQKITSAGMRQFSPLLAAIVAQGMREGVFTAPYPEQLGEVLLALFQGLGDSLATKLLSLMQPAGRRQREENLLEIEKNVAAYSTAITQILGAPAGSFCFIDAATLKEWAEAISNHNHERSG